MAISRHHLASIGGTFPILLMFLVSNSALAQIADSFDYPVSPPNATSARDGDGYYVAGDFGESRHLGEDWNGDLGGDTDFGDSVYSIANGTIVSARDEGKEWGNTIIIEHELPWGARVRSLYAHLSEMTRTSGTVTKGQKIGEIGAGYYYGDDANGDPIYDYTDAAHLHFEIRTNPSLGLGHGYSSNSAGYVDPSDFIDKRRSMHVYDIIGSCINGCAGTGNLTIYLSGNYAPGQLAVFDDFLGVTYMSSSGTVRNPTIVPGVGGLGGITTQGVFPAGSSNSVDILVDFDGPFTIMRLSPLPSNTWRFLFQASGISDGGIPYTITRR